MVQSDSSSDIATQVPAGGLRVPGGSGLCLYTTRSQTTHHVRLFYLYLLLLIVDGVSLTYLLIDARVRLWATRNMATTLSLGVAVCLYLL